MFSLRLIEDNLQQLVVRVNVPKPGSDKLRPLGISALEDKIVQSGLSKILKAIYEQDYIDDSYGFITGRGCHDALRALSQSVENQPINPIVEADIAGFFDNVDQNQLMAFPGEARLIRYADDFVVCFQTEADAKRFRMKRKTISKRFSAKLRIYKEWLKSNRTLSTPEIMKKTARKLRGHYSYYGVTDNSKGISVYYYEVKGILYKWLNRRGKKGCYNWEKFAKLLARYPLPIPRIVVNLF